VRRLRVIDTGSLAQWRARVVAALDTGGAVDVPCGTCSACCRSSYFIHIEPDEVAALRRIPRPLLFPAPGLPKGHVVLGYDEHGRCPMLVDDRCSIYDDRPRTCRQYDCRVFAATELSPDDDGKPLVAARVREWRFDASGSDDRAAADQLRAAVVRIRAREDAPATATQLAVAAVRESVG
jgi:Fe-S-cluster containining protein